MKICILLNGEVKDYNKTSQLIKKEKYDYIICADGGANHSNNMGIKPDYIIGDLDSVSEDVISIYRKLGVKFEEFPSKKNETDTELCIYLSQKLGAKYIDFIGALGNRVDHMLANINLLHYVRREDIVPRIISESEEVYIAINESIDIFGKANDTISVIPIKEDAKGVTLTNLEYPLYNYNMKFGLPLGVSNVMLDDMCSIEVKEGSLLIIRNI